MIKILLLTVSLCFIVSGTEAQIKKGSWLIGGATGLSYHSGKSNTQQNSTGFTISISPDAGYFFLDKFAAGLALYSVFHTSRVTNASGVDQKNNTVGFGAGSFIRYYFLNPSSQFNLLLEPSVTYKTTIYKNPDNSLPSFEYKLSAGPVIFLNKNIALEVLGYYNHVKFLKGENSTLYGIRLKKFGASLGFQIHLDKN